MSKSSKRVLIGTSEPDIFRSVEALVRLHLETLGGAVVTQVSHCDECVRLTSADNFDLVILAVNTLVPGGVLATGLFESSIQVIQAIKAGSRTPIIAMTTMQTWPELLLSAGADACLEMPFQVKDMAAAVDRCLDRNAEAS